MRIAVTYENGNVFQHFGHTEQFKLYDVENGKIAGTNIVNTNGSGHGALAGLISALNLRLPASKSFTALSTLPDTPP